MKTTPVRMIPLHRIMRDLCYRILTDVFVCCYNPLSKGIAGRFIPLFQVLRRERNSIKAQEIQLIYDYNYWATQRILDASANLSPEQFTQSTTYGWGSLRGILVHALDAEYSWRVLCQTQIHDSSDMITESDLPTHAALVQRWQEEKAAMRAYLDQLQDQDLTGMVRYTLENGQKRERVLWHCLLHVVNHGTQHRSEAALMLTALGHSPGDLDFTMFLKEHG